MSVIIVKEQKVIGHFKGHDRIIGISLANDLNEKDIKFNGNEISKTETIYGDTNEEWEMLSDFVNIIEDDDFQIYGAYMIVLVR